MSLKKQFLKSKPVCKVTFSLTKEEVNEAKKVILLGDFNNWNIKEGVVLKKLKDGSFKVAIDLETEKEYQFKYLLDGGNWVNDAEADKYVGNGMGAEENSVVIV
ncbi:MAG: isoamylase early set domain-containing protein [Lutibacter sp.]|nr:isoamylase early set domain-containing protein [Lutibacter sp.]MBP9601133.1 isoamylase early set domain-containing protein [Lutibacter sp.]